MPRTLTQYRVFIGSPSGLDEERKIFRAVLEEFTFDHAEKRGVSFYPVHWQDIVRFAGRPQDLINPDLERCDYAVFVHFDRWGSPTGDEGTSGTGEEWKLAEQLYHKAQIREIVPFFKKVDQSRLLHADEQLQKVIQFRKQIEEQKRYLPKEYVEPGHFRKEIERCLEQWLRDHEDDENVNLSDSDIPMSPPSVAPDNFPGPSFDFWIAEAARWIDSDQVLTRKHWSAVFCLEHAAATARSDIEWARATNSLGVIQSRLNSATESIAVFDEIFRRFDLSRNTAGRCWQAVALFNKARLLLRLRRRERALAVYRLVVEQFGTARELVLREFAAEALFRTATTLNKMSRFEQEVAVYDEIVALFDKASEPKLCKQVARALFDKADRLGLGEGPWPAGCRHAD